MNIVYTINCPACKVLEKKLIAADIPYQINTNTETHKNLGIVVYPMMRINSGELLSFGEAVKWINEEVNKRKNGSN